jgi:hypothetical protein
MSSLERKLRIVVEKNTFYQKKSPEVEEQYKETIDNIVRTIQQLKQKVKDIDVKDSNYKQRLLEILTDFLQNEQYGIESLLTLCGLSDEKLYRVISFLRIAHQMGLYESSSSWVAEEFVSEWKMNKIKRKLREDIIFAHDVAKLLLGENPLINRMFSLFDLKKLNPGKFLFLDEEMFDTLARYSLFGSYNAKKGKGAEDIIKEILEEMNVRYETGTVKNVRATIDFIIPSKDNPKIFIQSSYQGTTSSAQSRKARDELSIREDIKKNYPDAIFIQFIDGIGWIVRFSDLKTLVQAADYVFTFHEEQLNRFRKLLLNFLSKEDYKQNLRRFL